jgi:F0F1-type ATP synthase assembly protein I
MEEPEQQKQKNPKKQQNKGVQNFAKYSGLAFQMVAIILVTAFGGKKLDELLGLEKPVFTIVLSLLGVFAAIYTSVKDFIK